MSDVSLGRECGHMGTLCHPDVSAYDRSMAHLAMGLIMVSSWILLYILDQGSCYPLSRILNLCASLRFTYPRYRIFATKSWLRVESKCGTCGIIGNVCFILVRTAREMVGMGSIFRGCLEHQSCAALDNARWVDSMFDNDE